MSLEVDIDHARDNFRIAARRKINRGWRD